jgi:hypothetical protein
MKDIGELRNELAVLFDQIKTELIDVKQAAEMNNSAGKIIQSLKVELDYAALRQEKPSIKFLTYSSY